MEKGDIYNIDISILDIDNLYIIYLYTLKKLHRYYIEILIMDMIIDRYRHIRVK